jgi:hypothetical protein
MEGATMKPRAAWQNSAMAAVVCAAIGAARGQVGEVILQTGQAVPIEGSTAGVESDDIRVTSIHDSMPAYPISKYLHRIKARRPRTVTGPTWHELESATLGKPGSIVDSDHFKREFNRLIADFNDKHGSAGPGQFDFRLWGQEPVRWMQEHGL